MFGVDPTVRWLVPGVGAGLGVDPVVGCGLMPGINRAWEPDVAVDPEGACPEGVPEVVPDEDDVPDEEGAALADAAPARTVPAMAASPNKNAARRWRGGS